MSAFSIHDALRDSPVRLAPMARLTNLPFRRIAVRCGSGFTTNEEIDAEALVRDGRVSMQMMQTDPEVGPVAMQVLGNRVETLVPAALRLVEAGADIIDVNMGCPVPKIVRQGKGAALMRDVPATAQLLTALRQALGAVPLTIKIRGGWDDRHCNAVEVARMAEDVGVDAITVHPRTRAARFGGQAPWATITDVVRAVSIPVTGNGDVTSLTEARAMMTQTGCASVMVGRGALGRPWLFDAAYEALDPEARESYEASVITAHLDLIADFFPPRDALTQMKKHLSLYARGREGVSAFRPELFAQRDAPSVRSVFERAMGLSLGD